MGDHRNVSYDSRGHIGDPGGGTIPENQVVGRAFLIRGAEPVPVLPIPATFKQLTTARPSAPGLGELAMPAAPLAGGVVALPVPCWTGGCGGSPDRGGRGPRRGRAADGGLPGGEGAGNDVAMPWWRHPGYTPGARQD